MAIILQMSQIPRGVREKSTAMNEITLITRIVIINNREGSMVTSLTIIITEHILDRINRQTRKPSTIIRIIAIMIDPKIKITAVNSKDIDIFYIYLHTLHVLK
jgi:hypothetical protein